LAAAVVFYARDRVCLTVYRRGLREWCRQSSATFMVRAAATGKLHVHLDGLARSAWRGDDHAPLRAGGWDSVPWEVCWAPRPCDSLFVLVSRVDTEATE
jgi:hypothetical protein